MTQPISYLIQYMVHTQNNKYNYEHNFIEVPIRKEYTILIFLPFSIGSVQARNMIWCPSGPIYQKRKAPFKKKWSHNNETTTW